jgi:hypothetical protein
MKSRKQIISLVATGGLVLAIALLYLARKAAESGAPAAAADRPGKEAASQPSVGTLAAGGDRPGPAGHRGGPNGLDPAARAAVLRPVRSCVTNIVRELAKLRDRFNLTEAETNAVAQAVADCTVEYQAIHRRLARISAKDATRTIVSVPAFPEPGRTLEQELVSGIASALDDRTRGAELADALGLFLVRQFRGFGQYPREISIGIVRDNNGAPFYSFDDHWTGGWSGSFRGQPADVSFAAIDGSSFRPDDLEDFEFLRPHLPEITNAVTTTPPGVPAKP